MDHHQTNLSAFSDYIAEQDTDTLNKDWVLWMLKTLGGISHPLNPEWLRADYRNSAEPPMHARDPRKGVVFFAFDGIQFPQK